MRLSRLDAWSVSIAHRHADDRSVRLRIGARDRWPTCRPKSERRHEVRSHHAPDSSARQARTLGNVFIFMRFGSTGSTGPSR